MKTRSITQRIFTLFFIAFIIGCSGESVSPRDSTAVNGSGSGQGGSLARFTIVNNHLYVVTTDALFTYSLEDPKHPVLKNKSSIWAEVETIFSMNDYLFLGTRNGVEIYNISNPNLPSFTSRYTHIVSCDPVIARGDYAYSTLSTGTSCNRGVNRLDVINISNISNPQRTKSITMDNPKGLGLWNNFLFVCDNSNIITFNIASPSNPILITSLSKTYIKSCFDLIVTGDILIAVSLEGVTQFTINQDGSLTLLSTINVE
ncbi:MAG: hypothetical protein KJP21_02570 [Bacteroidia bacterium]|nr:hypothetical protein [Bacteroidia bacterium]NNJ54958.1 hypothetical protein [Bacteroidia bacterium]